MANDSRTPPPSRWAELSTEARHPASEDLDQRSTAEVVELLLSEDQRGLEAARVQAAALARGAEWLAATLEGGGSVVFFGAGASGRLGVLEAAECPPTFGTEPERIRALIAGGPEAVFAAREGAEDDAGAGREAASSLEAGDLAVGISASSVTPFVAGALACARQRGARTILLSCAAPGPGASPADLGITLATGPEILTGSTRLKAGSATKAALNALTSAAMVRLGKVYRGWMVDLRPGSAKLEDRALRILVAAGGVSRGEAEELFRLADRELKTALVMARLHLDPEAARERLRAARGHLRTALGEAGD